jgi:hypothetical protein
MTVTEIKTANYTASVNEVVPVDSSAGSFTITFPAGTPAAQSRIIVIDVGKACTTYPVTLGRNSNNFDGAAEDFVIDQNHGRVDASFDGVDDWALHLIGTPEIVNVSGSQVLLGTATVAGAAATTLTVSALDWSAYTAFQVISKVKNATGSNSNISIYYNADTTATNYHRQLHYGNGTSSQASRGNDGVIFTMLASASANFQARITEDLDGKPRVIASANSGNTTGMYHYAAASQWVTASNVTSITLFASVASSLAIGSTFSVYGIVP